MPITYKFTDYFENEVLRKRSYLQKEWCIEIIRNPIYQEVQEDNLRVRFWGKVADFDKILRIITLPDKITIHNAFPDRNFKR